MSADSRHKIIIDSDCGIDDAIALLLALGNKEVAEILAITCCFGNTTLDNACSNIMRVLTVCDEKKIPVHRGCAGPLIKRAGPVTVHGDDGLGNCAHEFSTGGLKESDIPAPLALINLAKKYPHQVTVIAIGPLTNLSVAHRIDPTFTGNLKSLVIMGGNYKGIGNVTEVAEFNFYCDPEAANIILSEAKCKVVLVPWETTMEYGIKWDTYNELIKIDTKKGNFFKRITALAAERSKKRRRNQVYDCDFLAVVALFYPHSIISSFKKHLAVECEGELTKGLTILLSKEPKDTISQTTEIITDYDMNFLNTIRKRMLN